MSAVMEEDINRWTARRKTALVLEIIQGKTTVAEASWSFDLPPSEIRKLPLSTPGENRTVLALEICAPWSCQLPATFDRRMRRTGSAASISGCSVRYNSVCSRIR